MAEYTTRDILLQNSDGENLNPYVNKLGNSTIGSSTQPIYLNSGSPTLCDELANADLSNLSETGESHFCNPALTNSPYTTNRILEIPQDIQMELDNGTLTLKAGSKV